jgi:hypothetical protein
VSLRDRDGLIARIRQIRRAEEASSEAAAPASQPSEQDEISSLKARISHLEHLLQGLQDSVHREAIRQGKRIADLEARIEPDELSRALSADARERGLEQ